MVLCPRERRMSGVALANAVWEFRQVIGGGLAAVNRPRSDQNALRESPAVTKLLDSNRRQIRNSLIPVIFNPIPPAVP